MNTDEFLKKIMPILDQLNCVKDPESCEGRENCCLVVEESNECIRDIWGFEILHQTGKWPIVFDHNEEKWIRD